MTTTPRTWVVGEVVTAAYLNTEIRDQWNSVIGAWTSWTPTWDTTTGTATPSPGNWTTACRYLKIGRTVLFRFDIVFGSTTNFGAGGTGDNWRFSLPAAAANTASEIGFVELNQSTGSRAVARMNLDTTTKFMLDISSGMPSGAAMTNTGVVDAVTPWTWASGHAIRGIGIYEAAS